MRSSVENQANFSSKARCPISRAQLDSFPFRQNSLGDTRHELGEIRGGFQIVLLGKPQEFGAARLQQRMQVLPDNVRNQSVIATGD
jgi:hypothetical protein